ncbi:MAG: glutamine--fructose-6-phosphate transaminase (isomerizing) [Blastocatellia bacterium]|nr:glutamine--fructose-6-phosphate transaminase (isomerizing) [Blastocatellia bacterium]MCS7156233.1 glutamine--fructose-6-phosphate transaminase (isomerizing) [Blastocatellia bacterium]MCX7751417.1 glutamine--fructose-6-phosphate transaminase (isomerizing) [Blastocatellia bacterium]MDW8169130.1 glutamine--fructose-6-phosphate transaminase (isomerizing) [Acidobacteriota bacterium]MDW8255991.1 glutamine--fructose-6-phosphate transaminase (isomerizing) [Acidobacteriota bacterium]
MSGIIGYVGPRQIIPILLHGLRRLEYRGYDSAGLAVVDEGRLEVRRAAGKLRQLEELIRLQPLDGTYGIGHTRWATHGRPTAENAHPHCDCSGRLAVVHNGIVENYLALKHQLAEEGHTFRTETDTEVIAHLIEKYLQEPTTRALDPEVSLEKAVRAAVREMTGVFAMAIISADVPETIVAVRQGPPVVIGLGHEEYFVASDVLALLYYTRDVFFLEDGQIAVLTRRGVRVSDWEGNAVTPRLERIGWEPILVEKGGFPNFMLKEIYEQPRALRELLKAHTSPEGRSVHFEELEMTEEQIRQIRTIRLVGCGGSWHAALAGEFLIEHLARVPTEVDYSSEFRYRDPILEEGTLVVALSQSGETADTLAAVREARRRGAPVLAICNVRGATLTREANGTIFLQAGPEIGVASTKAFTAELMALYLLAIYLAEQRGTLTTEYRERLVREAWLIPEQLERVLAKDDAIRELARSFARVPAAFFLGRGLFYPIALEGALLLKELAYLYAEGYPAGELKHGPNALIEAHLPIVVINARDPESPLSQLLYEKTLANIIEAKAREGRVLGIVTEGDVEVRQVADDLLEIPTTSYWLLPILATVPLQLLAYHTAVLKGCDVDQPRHLAKSVTVE